MYPGTDRGWGVATFFGEGWILLLFFVEGLAALLDGEWLTLDMGSAEGLAAIAFAVIVM